MLRVLCVCVAGSLAVPPVVIVPGDGANQLEARLVNKPSVPHRYCSKNADWYRLWLSTVDLLAATSCWAENIRLVIDAETGRATNSPGVETRVPHWGTTTGFEEIDPSVPAHATSAFYQMVAAFLDAGWERNVTLRGAPYDFRYTPDSDPSFCEALRSLVEETVEAQGGARATLISHSMGGLQVQYFLNQMSAEWKARYVERWIPISTPFAGAAKEARLFATGDREGLPISASALRDEQRTYETNHFLFPSIYASSPWTGVELVRTDDASFTAADYAAFFDAIEFPVGTVVHDRVRGLIPDPSQPPGVRVFCVYSTGIDTPLSFYYAGSDFSKDPQVATGDGDGVVNLNSLKVCEAWDSANTDVLTFQDLSHSKIIQDATVIAAIIGIINQTTAPQRPLS